MTWHRFLVMLPAIACVTLTGQSPAPAPLENSGKPMRIPFSCSQEDLHSLGLTCPPDQPCPVYLELIGLEALGNSIFAAGNLHTDDTTLFSILLASYDGGRTWREPHERSRGAGLDLIQFIDVDTGWVSGQSLGAVLRDPFLLLTGDGGGTWRSRPVFAESRAGVIDFFRFDSPTHGTLWIDRTQSGETANRYEAYESMTGGESWMLKQTAETPLRTGPRPTAPADWRLRADPAAKAYRLERRAGKAWELVASFLIGVGECREPEVTLPAEPDVPPPDEEHPQPPGAAQAR
ncbi:MAG: hypothetical protein ABSD27_06655 [Bryobacteraceae bacterium]|jgi:hypothetical protein